MAGGMADACMARSNYAKVLPREVGRAVPRCEVSEAVMRGRATKPIIPNIAFSAISGLLACLLCGAPAQAETKLPPVDDLLRDLKFTGDDWQKAKRGKIIEKSYSEGSDRELSLGFTLLVKGKPEDVARMYRGAQDLKMIKVITAHVQVPGEGTLADFEKAVLQPNPEKEADRYLDAEPGDTLNLDEKEIAAFQALKSPNEGKAVPVKEVEQLIRQNLLARHQAYRAKGLAGLVPYQRSKDTRLSARDELLLATKQSVGLKKYVPTLYDVLANYPAAKARLEQGEPAKSKDKKAAKGRKEPKDKEEQRRFEESFHWFNVDIFGRPTFVLEHRLSMFVDYAFIAVERQYYASHDYNSMQQIVAAIPTKDGTLLLYIGRVSTDQVAGLTSDAMHPVARAIAAPYIKDMFEAVRDRLEKK